MSDPVCPKIVSEHSLVAVVDLQLGRGAKLMRRAAKRCLAAQRGMRFAPLLVLYGSEMEPVMLGGLINGCGRNGELKLGVQNVSPAPGWNVGWGCHCMVLLKSYCSSTN